MQTTRNRPQGDESEINFLTFVGKEGISLETFVATWNVKDTL